MQRAIALLLVVCGTLLAACTSDADDAAAPRARRDRLASLPVERTEVAGVNWNGEIVVVGGLTDDGGASARADAYDPDEDSWRRLPDLPVPIHHAGIAVAGDRVVVVGGYTNEPGEPWRLEDGVHALGPGGEWEPVSPLREPRGALAAVTIGDRIVAVGGVTEDGVATRVESLSAERTGEWTREPDLGTAREHLAAAAVDGRVYAIAGRAPGNLDAVESWMPGEAEWREEPAVRHARSGIGAAQVDGMLCVAGGEGPEGTIAPIECRGDREWVVVAELATPRHGLAVVATGGRLHVISGGPRPGLTVSGAHEVFDLPT